MRPSGRALPPRPQTSQTATTQSTSTHFHYESIADITSIQQTQNTASRTSHAPRHTANHTQNTDSYRDFSVILPTRREDLVSIHEYSLEDEKAFPSGRSVESYQSEEPSSSYSFRQAMPAVTAQKSRMSRANHSSETSSDDFGREGPNPLDQTFSYDASKFAKDRQFQFCDTPKLPKETKSQKASKPKQEDTGRDLDAKDVRMVFVKYEEGEQVYQGRRYPYRASRAVPRLKYWEGERADPNNHGYWKRTT